MTDHAHDEHRPSVKLYLKVFAALLALTVLTVGVSYLHHTLFSHASSYEWYRVPFVPKRRRYGTSSSFNPDFLK